MRYPGRCRACGQPIIFAVVGNKQGRAPSRMPLNPAPDPAGNVAVYRDHTGARLGRVLGKDGKAMGYERVYMPHFATCENRKQAGPVPPGVTSLDAWRKAAAEHAADGRRRRRKPKPAAYRPGMARKPP